MSENGEILIAAEELDARVRELAEAISEDYAGRDVLLVCVRVPLQARYVGFEMPDRFVVGYGLDHAEQLRNLPHIAVLG